MSWKFYQRIALPEVVAKKLIDLEETLNFTGYDHFIRDLNNKDKAKEQAFKLKALLEPDPDRFKLLYCYLKAAEKAWSFYQEKGISEEIYIATMKGFTRMLEETRNRFGEYNFDKAWWLYRFTDLSIFRIGALEYEPGEKNGEKVISIHIPSDALLSSEEIDKSLKSAEKFIESCFPDYRDAKYRCNSWLLAKELEPFLDENSNIRAFQKRFMRIGETKSEEYKEFLFKVPEETPIEDLPENTSLQRKVKQFLLSGGEISWTEEILKI